MATIFKALSREERVAQQKAYLEHLKARDGKPDIYHCTLENREQVYEAYRANPVQYDGAVPVREFWELHRSGCRKANPQTPPVALWMSILARINAGEKYGVELGIQRYRTAEPDFEDPVTYLEMEEFYHTHILGDALKVLGVNVPIENPTGVTKWFVTMLAKFPKNFSFPFILMAEVAATLVFVELWKSAKKFFGTETEAGRRIVWLVEQILVDEVGHIAFAQSKLGQVRLWFAKLMIPFVAKAMIGDIPSLGVLYDAGEIARNAQRFSFDDLPPEIRAQAFVPAAYRAEEPAAAAAAA